MEYQYYICDVFTNKVFGGNQLAVFPNAAGLSTEQMQNITREFNFSETTFVLPAKQQGTREVRIFTPSREVPFAGHPNVGTAFVLTEVGEIDINEPIIFEEKAGLVQIQRESFEQEDQQHGFKLQAPEAFSTGQDFSASLLARALSVKEHEVITANHPPIVASAGLTFICVELASLDALERAKVFLPGFEELEAMGVMPDIHCYVRCEGEVNVRARMFAPMDGVHEDPATGSANCALAGLLASCDQASSGEYNFHIQQGVEMGRPSDLYAYAIKQDNRVTATGVAGNAVMFASGTIVL